MLCEQCFHDYDWRQAEKVQVLRTEANIREAIERSRRGYELFRQEYQRHFQQIAAATPNDPYRNFLAYITYNPVDRERRLQLDEEVEYEYYDEVVPTELECEMDALRAAQVESR
jgi:hypothetical protein